MKSDAARGLAVPTCPASFLVISLEATGELPVHNEAHVRSVHPHAERVRGDHQGGATGHEVPLYAASLPVLQPGVISFRSETQPREVVPNRLNGATGPGIDQGGTRPLSLTQGRS